MVSKFVVFDLIFLVAFTLAVALFLYIRRDNLQRQGLLYLYRTRVGIKIMDWTVKNFSGILRPAQYIIIASGYILLVFMVWFLAKFSWFYITSPFAAEALKIPILTPLIPYLPTLFKIDFLPPFYFTYWIIIIAIIAIPHEFAHGIFARLHKIKVHSTGFGFLGPFLAAFVEPDEKQMEKLPKVPQLAVLAAGTFANVLTTILFGAILWVFFISAFAPVGVIFNTYSTTVVNTSGIDLNDVNFSIDDSFIGISIDGETYFTNPQILRQTIAQDLDFLIVFEDSPAFNAKLSGAISEIGGTKIRSFEDLSQTLGNYKPGDTVNIKTVQDNGTGEYEITLDERNGKAFLGIGIIPLRSRGILGSFYGFIAKIKDPTVLYQSNLGDLGIFIFDLLWWIVIICISVALVNMLPVGIFDGGRFFYLTIWGLTKSKRAGEIAFALSTWAIILLIAALMVRWVFAIT